MYTLFKTCYVVDYSSKNSFTKYRFALIKAKLRASKKGQNRLNFLPGFWSPPEPCYSMHTSFPRRVGNAHHLAMSTESDRQHVVVGSAHPTIPPFAMSLRWPLAGVSEMCA